MATIYKVGKCYYIQWTEGGRRARRSLGKISQQDAEQVLALHEARLTERRITGKSATTYANLTLNDFITDYLAWRRSEYPASQRRVYEAFKNHLLPAFGHLQLSEIKPIHVEQWKIHRKAAPATIKKELDCLKACMTRAVAWELIERNPILHVKPPKNLVSKPPRWYTHAELSVICETSNLGPLWRFMANTGLRRAEAMKARREHIVDGVLRIYSTTDERTKSGKWRPVPLSPGAIDALQYLGDDYLAPRVYAESLSRSFKRDAGEIGGSIHCLRHTFCSHLVMAGVDLRTVQELAGHQSYETTLKYAHLSESHLSQAVAKIDL